MLTPPSQTQSAGGGTPLYLFKQKAFLQGEGFSSHTLQPRKAYQLASYNPQQYAYVKQNSDGTSKGIMQGGVYYKVDDGANALRPAKEQAVYTFYKRLLGYGIAPTHLLVVNGIPILPARGVPERDELEKHKRELGVASVKEVFNVYPQLERKISHALAKEEPVFLQGSLYIQGKTLGQYLEAATPVEKTPWGHAESLVWYMRIFFING